jgi:GNAT superfamily N-acetyltransferase
MIDIRRMTIDDLTLGLRLSRQARWNQTESDWRRFMNMEPEGCFVAEFNGLPVGTTTTCVFRHQVAWIAMVLVDKDVRGRGIGTTLLTHALDYLNARKIGTVRLDATAAGRPIYEKLGFVAEYELARFEGAPDSRSWMPGCGTAILAVRDSTGWKPVPRVSSIEHRASDIMELDRRMTGTDRAKMLSRLFEEFPEHLRLVMGGDILEGFVTARPGANAVQIGPCVATVSAGPSLLSDALNRCVGKPVFVDIPLDNARAVKIAESSGLKVQRCFTRMCRGVRVNDDVQALWASSGPEKG